MDDSLIHARGRYNATDQDVLNAQATKRGWAEIEDDGYKLINRSYVIVFDAYAIGDYDIKLKGKTTTSKGVSVFAIIYEFDLKENVLNKIFEDCWIYESDDQSTIAKKNEAFDGIEIPMKERLAVSEVVFEDKPSGTSLVRHFAGGTEVASYGYA